LVENQNLPVSDDFSDNSAQLENSESSAPVTLVENQNLPTVSSHHPVDREARQALIAKKKNSRRKK